jgi:hypothetical protein
MLSVAFIMALAAVGFTRGASAGVTVDLIWQDTGTPTLTIPSGDAGPGCTLGGPNSGANSPTSGRCLDIIVTVVGDRLTGLGQSVGYSPLTGLSFTEGWQWFGTTFTDPQTGKTATFSPVTAHTLQNLGAVITDINGIVAPPNGPPSLPAGTYKIGTIVWNTTGATTSSILTAFITGADGYANGAHVLLTPILNSAFLNVTVVPEPGTASLLGLGLVGLIVAGRRSRK